MNPDIANLTPVLTPAVTGAFYVRNKEAPERGVPEGTIQYSSLGNDEHKNMFWDRNHMHLLSEQALEEGCVYYDPRYKQTFKLEQPHNIQELTWMGCKKIEMSSDKDLHVPEIPSDYIAGYMLQLTKEVKL